MDDRSTAREERKEQQALHDARVMSECDVWRLLMEWMQ